MDFTEMPRGPAEAAEGIECLRFLEHGKSIKMVETEYMGVEIDTPEDVEAAERLLKQLQMD
jgi:CMP-2-keto-3-deoxyoctulosonic acid synthetase